MAKKHSKPVRKSRVKPKAKAARAAKSRSKPKARAKPARKPAARKLRRAGASAGRKGAAKKPLARGGKKPAGKRSPAPKSKARSAKPGVKTAGKNTPAKVAPKAPPALAPKPAKTPAKLNGKTPGKQPLVAGRNGAAAAKPGTKPAVKPSAGEIAARLSARRTEKALAEGKVRSGKNGGVEPRKVELSPAEAEARKTRLKNLIVLGKERSYLTYAEINDHLPDDILDAEQIEGIISMINDMGIQVYDEAPDAEQLLMSEAAPTTAAADVDVEAAEAAASTLDSEFGRTTDPVRMYMREMGSVELLTREGEIEIAKRIEEGLKYMIMAISACPMTVAQILDLAAKIEKDELKIDDVVDGLMDFNEQLEAMDDEDVEEGEEAEDNSGAIAAENLERLKVAALTRFGVIRRLYTRMLGVLQKEGHKAPKYLELQKKISAELMQIRFAARQVERLCDSVRCEVDNIRQIERKIQDLVVNKGGMPRPDFIKKFPEHETSLRWIDREIATHHP
jgi:RNA polymerase primary sigma factor